MLRSVGCLLPLLDVASEHGVSRAACLDGSGIPLEAVADPYFEIESAQHISVVRRFLALIGDRSGIGLMAGGRFHLSHYGIVGYALQCSATLRQSLALGFDNRQLFFATSRAKVVNVDGNLHVVVDERGVPEDVRQFMLEAHMMGIYVGLVDILQRSSGIDRVQFRFAEPADSSQYHRAFQCPILFGQESNVVVIDGTVLDLPLPQACELTARMAEEQCHQILARRRSRSGIAARVRRVLLQKFGPAFSAEEVADELGMTSRTLRRRLQREGTTFRLIVREARELLAEELLSTTCMTLEEIADRLGYSESATFARAFKLWKGVSPRRYQSIARGTRKFAN